MYQEYIASWVDWILSMVRRRFFEDRKSDHGIADEKKEVCVDQDMHRSI
jgi:hypothetical protein